MQFEIAKKSAVTMAKKLSRLSNKYFNTHSFLNLRVQKERLIFSVFNFTCGVKFSKAPQINQEVEFGVCLKTFVKLLKIEICQKTETIGFKYDNFDFNFYRVE